MARVKDAFAGEIEAKARLADDDRCDLCDAPVTYWPGLIEAFESTAEIMCETCGKNHIEGRAVAQWAGSMA